MSSFVLSLLTATVATTMAQGTQGTQNCDASVIGLSSALGVLFTGVVAAAVYQFKNRICCTKGDSTRIYDAPCPYCTQKQPRDCMREHLADCFEHRKYWSPRLTRQESSPLRVPRPSRLVMRVLVPIKPASLDKDVTAQQKDNENKVAASAPFATPSFP